MQAVRIPWLSARLQRGVPLYQEPSVTALGSDMAVAGLAGGVEEAVGDNAVVLGIEAGNEGEVVGKGERGIAGQHAFGRPDALAAKSQKVGGVVAFGVVPAEAVKRDEDNIVLLLCVGRVGAVVDVGERECRAEGCFLRRQGVSSGEPQDQQDRRN